MSHCNLWIVCSLRQHSSSQLPLAPSSRSSIFLDEFPCFSKLWRDLWNCHSSVLVCVIVMASLNKFRNCGQRFRPRVPILPWSLHALTLVKEVAFSRSLIAK
eukprot:3344104-Rhodomonas_salina.2